MNLVCLVPDMAYLAEEKLSQKYASHLGIYASITHKVVNQLFSTKREIKILINVTYRYDRKCKASDQTVLDPEEKVYILLR